MKRLLTLSALLFAVPAFGGTRSPLNMSGSGWLGVATVDVEGEPWAEVRMSGGGHVPDGTTAFGAEAAFTKHATWRMTASEAGELAGMLEKWDASPHNQMVYESSEPGMGLTFLGQDGLTWGPEFQPIVVVAIQEWAAVGSRGHLHGGIYVALTRAQVVLLSQALTAWWVNPVVTSGLIYQMQAE